jgi:hypothetical protein
MKHICLEKDIFESLLNLAIKNCKSSKPHMIPSTKLLTLNEPQIQEDSANLPDEILSGSINGSSKNNYLYVIPVDNLGGNNLYVESIVNGSRYITKPVKDSHYSTTIVTDITDKNCISYIEYFGGLVFKIDDNKQSMDIILNFDYPGPNNPNYPNYPTYPPYSLPNTNIKITYDNSGDFSSLYSDGTLYVYKGVYNVAGVVYTDYSKTCRDGYYSLQNNQYLCLSCPPGQYCPSPSSPPEDCPAGQYCPSKSKSPTACPAGKYCPSGSSFPINCPAGKYCPSESISPQTCPDGYYCPENCLKPLTCPVNAIINKDKSSCCYIRDTKYKLHDFSGLRNYDIPYDNINLKFPCCNGLNDQDFSQMINYSFNDAKYPGWTGIKCK